MLARCVATLKPPPELTLSQWADRYRMLSAESSAEPGRWHTDKAPYQREIMDAIGDAHIRRVVIMCAAQLGKTELLLNILGYFMAYAPAPILVMQPTLDMGQTFSKDRLAPMIRDTPVLRGLVDVKSRYAGNTILKKNFPGGHITIVGANSATGLASRPIKVLLADEVDRYPGSAGTEGDPLSLAQKRQTTFWDKKTVMVSTPVIKGHSRIETEYNQSTREEWNVPCPECGHYQPFVWANLIFEPDDLQKEIVYKCERCGCVANEYRWKQQSQQGRFVAENPGAETRGFHLNTLASTFCGWKEIVQKFIVAKEQLDQGNPEGMKVWVNTELGETWEERGEQVEDTELFNRREIYDAVVPEEVLVLTAGVDVQDDRFEVEIVGWGVGKESWGIRYQKIYGDMLKEQVWEDLDAFLQTVWCKKDGTALRIISCCMLEEWFEYGGQPGTFRLYINVTDTTEEHPAIIYSPAEMERRLITAKRWSAHLESLSYMVRHTLATGCRVDKWAYTVPECGTIYCGVWWMPATLGYTAHHALLTGGQPGAFAVSPEFTGTLPVPATVGYSVCGALRSGGVATGYTASPEFAGTLPEEAQHGN